MNDTVSHTPTHGGVYRVDEDGNLNKELDHFGQKVAAEETAESTETPTWHPKHKATKKGK